MLGAEGLKVRASKAAAALKALKGFVKEAQPLREGIVPIRHEA
jgi:hypothetical protein